MRTLIIIASCLIFIGSCWAGFAPLPDATLHTYSSELENSPFGKGIMKGTFRGRNQILIEMNYSNSASRLYFFHGKLMFAEYDNNGDGFFESLIISGDTMDDFEQFTRMPDGTVEPVSKEKYLELWSTNRELSKYQKQIYKQALEEMEKKMK